MTRIDFYCLFLVIGGPAFLCWLKCRSLFFHPSPESESPSGDGKSLVCYLSDETLVGIGAGLSISAALIFIMEYAGRWLVFAVMLYLCIHFVRSRYKKQKLRFSNSSRNSS